MLLDTIFLHSTSVFPACRIELFLRASKYRDIHQWLLLYLYEAFSVVACYKAISFGRLKDCLLCQNNFYFPWYRDVHQKWIEGGNYELCIEDVRDEIWDMVKPVDPLKITSTDLLNCKQGGTVASMLIDVRGFWAHDNRENLLQEEEEPEEEWI